MAVTPNADALMKRKLVEVEDNEPSNGKAIKLEEASDSEESVNEADTTLKSKNVSRENLEVHDANATLKSKNVSRENLEVHDAASQTEDFTTASTSAAVNSATEEREMEESEGVAGNENETAVRTQTSNLIQNIRGDNSNTQNISQGNDSAENSRGCENDANVPSSAQETRRRSKRLTVMKRDVKGNVAKDAEVPGTSKVTTKSRVPEELYTRSRAREDAIQSPHIIKTMNENKAKRKAVTAGINDIQLKKFKIGMKNIRKNRNINNSTALSNAMCFTNDVRRPLPVAGSLQVYELLEQYPALKLYMQEIQGYPDEAEKGDYVYNIIQLHTQIRGDGTARDERMLSRCMKNTFTLRWYEVTQLQFGIGSFIEHFPGLTDYKQIRREFNRFSSRNVDRFEALVVTLVYGIKSGSSSKLNVKKLLNFIRTNHPDGQQVYKYSSMKRNEVKVLEKHDRKEPTIIISRNRRAAERATLFCEFSRVVSGLTVHKAFLAAFYIHHIFHIEYTPEDALLWGKLDTLLALTPRSQRYL
ncbi:unnamed protein product [Orchesella dallaii]|uniref:Uncharacterized protein n=1 Tax=Orchesella dallaii TaxID=48710 RepID=A0ABP1RBV6_9HEXA